MSKPCKYSDWRYDHANVFFATMRDGTRELQVQYYVFQRVCLQCSRQQKVQVANGGKQYPCPTKEQILEIIEWSRINDEPRQDTERECETPQADAEKTESRDSTEKSDAVDVGASGARPA